VPDDPGLWSATRREAAIRSRAPSGRKLLDVEDSDGTSDSRGEAIVTTDFERAEEGARDAYDRSAQEW
jgi:hypothetical protein